jgi:hypothetical protein
MTNYRNEETRLGVLEARLAAIEARLDALASGPRPETLHAMGQRLFRECLTDESGEGPGRPSPREASDDLSRP